MAHEHSYQTYFVAAKNRSGETRIAEAPDHIAAKAAAKVMLGMSEYISVEVYEGRRLVGELDGSREPRESTRR